LRSNVFCFPSGLRVALKRVEKNRPVTIFVCVKTGAVNEPEDKSGISHFVEHLSFKGTKRRSAKDLSTQLEEVGANANAFTTKTSTCFYATGLQENIESYFDILSDIIFDSKYDEADIEKERKVIYEEIDMYDDDPESVCYEEFVKNFYAGTPLSRSVLGTKESLKNITRGDITEYVSSNYVASNIVVSVVGNFGFEKIKKLTSKYFEKYLRGQKPQEKNTIISSVIVPDKSVSFVKKDIAQTQIALGFVCDNIFSKNRMAYTLMCFIFGGGMGSRLFQSVREDLGLVYNISCMPEFYETGGDVVITLGTNDKNRSLALSTIKAQIDKVLDEGFCEEELKRAKTFCKSLISSSHELGSDIARSMAKNIAIFSRDITLEERLEKVDQVTLFDINEIAKKTFNYSNMCASCVSKTEDENLFNVFE